jgi:hypothetical protein
MVFVAAAGLAICAWSPSRAEATDCTRDAGPPERPGPPLKNPIKLTPVEPTATVNFGPGDLVTIGGGTLIGVGEGYASKEIDVVLTASRRLPKSVKPSQIEINAPRRLARADPTLETVLLRRPTFTQPQFIDNRQRVAFTVCLDPADIHAGSYTGEISVGGPTRLGRAVVAVTANAKDGWLFQFGLLAALAAVLLLLIYRAYTEMEDNQRLRDVTVKRFSWWAGLAVSLVAAYIAAIAVYTQDPAWGDDQAPSIIALAGAALAGAGVNSVITTLRKPTPNSAARTNPPPGS